LRRAAAIGQAGAVSVLASFVGISLLVIAAPGPDTALTIRNTLVGGRRNGVFTAIGVASGLAVWTVATSAGLAALLVASEPAFVAVKVAGAAYLIFLGTQALRTALRQRRLDARRPSAPAVPPRVALRQGLISNLGNPKIAVFFTSLLPQFAPGEPSFAALLGLGLLFCALTLGWLTAYAFVVGKAGDVLRRRRVRRAFDALTGSVLVALGIRLAAEHR
jgi:threonine/homoserine/homoserine lactone efflux protein